MTSDQVLLFLLLGGILGLLLWGRFRHDLVAAGGLFAAVVLGLVPEAHAFSGFANPAVVIVALVLIASRAIENSGALTLLTRVLEGETRSIPIQVALTGSVAASLSAVINNVAALALLMPYDIQAARRAGRPPSLTLMPLSFATILGGMVTLIGTPPNIIASTIRADRLGAPYQMFDFAPVGIAVALAGIAFVALIGWRLVPRREDKGAVFVRESSFKAELLVPSDSAAIGRVVASLDEEAERADVLILAVVRNDMRNYARARGMTLQVADILLVEGSADGIAQFIKTAGLQEAVQEPVEAAAAAKPAKKAESPEGSADESERGPPKYLDVVEAVVRGDSRLVGASAKQLDLRSRFGVTLLGIARAGAMTREHVRDRMILSGDMLLLTGRGAASDATLDLLGFIPINRIGVEPVRPWAIALAVGAFTGAVLAAVFGLLSFSVGLAIAVALYGAAGLIPPREFYQQIEWPVVVMLACLIPIGAAFENVGGTALIANAIAQATAGYAPVVALVAVMAVTMTLSDVLNNVATMVITAPIAIDLAQRMHVNPDTMLMGVAVAASCAFLTPIGHKNNTLIMGPGGYRFADYWPMGLGLEAVVLAVSVPMLLIVWPF